MLSFDKHLEVILALKFKSYCVYSKNNHVIYLYGSFIKGMPKLFKAWVYNFKTWRKGTAQLLSISIYIENPTVWLTRVLNTNYKSIGFQRVAWVHIMLSWKLDTWNVYRNTIVPHLDCERSYGHFLGFQTMQTVCSYLYYHGNSNRWSIK